MTNWRPRSTRPSERPQSSSISPMVLAGSFAHALIREALYEGIVSMRRRAWHRRVAEVLAASSHPDPDVIAHHFQQANDDRAIDWLIRAGERAASLYASKTAVERLEAALPALEAMGDDRRRGWILWLLGEQFGFIDTGTFHRLFLTMPNGSDRRSATSFWSRTPACIVGMSVNHGQTVGAGVPDVISGVDLLDELLGHSARAAADSGPGLVTPKHLSCVSRAVARDCGDLEPALEDIPEYATGEVDKEFNQQADSRSKMAVAATLPMSYAYNALARIRAMQGRTAEAARAFQKCTALMARTNDNAQHGNMLKDWLAYLVLPYFADDLELRRTLLEQHDRAWEQAAERFGVGPMPAGVSHLLTSYIDGAWSKMEWIQEWWHEHLATSAASWGIVPQVVFGRRAHARGEIERAWHEIRSYLPQRAASEPGDYIFRGAEELQRLAIELSIVSRDLSGAREWLEAHDRWLAWSGALTGRAEGALLWAQYHLVSGDQNLARQTAEQALALASDPRQPLALIAVHRFLGHLDTAERQFESAEEHFQVSLRLATACAAPFERALTLLKLAELRFAERHPDEAATLLDDVQDICEPLEARPTLERVNALRQQISQLSPRAPSYPAGLSQREVEVLRLVADGLTDGEIAERLFLSRRTVNAHLRSVYNKIGISSRAAATRFATEHQLI